MPRLPRFNLPGVPQHIIQRGNNRQACFFTGDDYRFYLECLKAAAAREGCDIHAYVLMTNHVHVLATPRMDRAVSRMMQSVGRRYVQYVNYRYQRTGTLWEGRYKASLVESSAYLLSCYRYIEQNPVRAMYMVQHPGDYEWSSFQANAHGKGDAWLTPHPEYQALGKSRLERQQNYRELFSDVLDARLVGQIRESVNQGIVLGTDGFRADIESALSIRARPGRRGRPARNKRVS